MKKLLWVTLVLIGINVPHDVLGQICANVACSGEIESYTPPHCRFANPVCYGTSNNLIDYSCSSCDSGYVISKLDVYDPVCGVTVTINECVQICSGCSGCTSDTSWSAAATGYQKRVSRTCDCNTCRSVTSYQCAPGYYGSSMNGATGCNACPSGGTSAAGTTAITGCYLPAGQTGADTSGGFQYVNNCYYN